MGAGVTTIACAVCGVLPTFLPPTYVEGQTWVCAGCRAASADRPDSAVDRRMREQPLPCCGPDGCTGGASCWHDEPDNIPEDWA